jgi:hypothetical protein
MGKSISPVLLMGGGLAAYLLLSNKSSPGGASPVTSLLSNLTGGGSVAPVNSGPQTTYPYLITGAPLPIPDSFSQSYYINEIYPAMYAVNSNVKNPAYTLTQAEASQYETNYTDLQGWLRSFKSGTPYQHLVYHWHTYGVPDQRTFLPLPWANPAQWVPPPPNTKSSGGIFSDILKAVTVIGGGVAIVASGGALAPVVGPATSLALTAEGQIHGVNSAVAPNDAELEILFTGGAIWAQIAPFYNQADQARVKAVNNQLYYLLNRFS